VQYKGKAYLPLIRHWASLYRVPWAIVYGVCEVESGWNPNAVRFEPHLGESSYGLMQVLYSTALNMGFSEKKKPDMLLKPRPNIHMGTKYLRWCYDRYQEIPEIGDRWKFAVACYNAGRGNINKMLRLARKFEGKGIKDSGEWQKWEFAQCFLPSVTGKSAGITMQYILKLRRVLAELDLTVFAPAR